MAVAIVGALIVTVTGFSGRSAVARAAVSHDNNSNPYFTLSVPSGSTQSVSDGQAIPFTVTRTPQATTDGLEIAALGFGWCQQDVQLPTLEDGTLQNFGALLTGFPIVQGPQSNLNCLDTVNGDLSYLTAPLPTIAPSQNALPNIAGGTGDYPSAKGIALAQVGTGTGPPGEFQGLTVTCDVNDPCTLGVAIWTKNVLQPTQDNIYFVGVPVTFQAQTATAACNGAVAGQLQTSSPDRLGQIVTNWAINACKLGYGGGAALVSNTASSKSDASALCDFASGSADMVFSAVGNAAGSGSDFSPASCGGSSTPVRPYVAIPVALNAVVLSHVQDRQIQTPYGGFGTAVSDYAQPLDITAAQFAQLLSNGGTVDANGTTTTLATGDWDSALGTSLSNEDPDLLNGNRAGGGFCSSCSITGTGTGSGGIAATSGTDATTLFVTDFMKALSPSQLWSRSQAPLGTTSNFGTGTAKYWVQTYTGSSILGQYLTPVAGKAWWAVTDAATAAATWGGLADFDVQAPDSLGQSTPVFVSPNSVSMQAAVTNMVAQPDGTLSPNANGGAVNGVEPYPLTYVEFAIVPTQPLLNADCSPNTAAQQALTQWMTYLLSDGQRDLPAGMAPLPNALVDQARTEISSIGTAPASCIGTSTTSAPSAANGAPAQGAGSSNSGGVTAAPSPNGGSFLTPFGSLTGAFGNSAGTGATPSSSSTKPGSSAGRGGGTHLVELASFNTFAPTSWALPLLGVLVLAFLLPGLILLVSGRPLSEALGGSTRFGRRPEDQSPIRDGDES